MQYLLDKGGILIYPLLLSSLIAMTIILERVYTYLKISWKFSDGLMNKIKEYLQDRNINKAAELCETAKGPVGRILKKGILNSHRTAEDIEKEMHEAEWDVLPPLEKGLGMLNFIGKVSPTLGLLGTVTGMIKTFHILSLNGEGQQLAGGISEALLTTAIGLVISIPALGAYHFFISKIQKLTIQIEKREIELLNFLQNLKADTL